MKPVFSKRTFWHVAPKSWFRNALSTIFHNRKNFYQSREQHAKALRESFCCRAHVITPPFVRLVSIFVQPVKSNFLRAPSRGHCSYGSNSVGKIFYATFSYHHKITFREFQVFKCAKTDFECQTVYLLKTYELWKVEKYKHLVVTFFESTTEREPYHQSPLPSAVSSLVVHMNKLEICRTSTHLIWQSFSKSHNGLRMGKRNRFHQDIRVRGR